MHTIIKEGEFQRERDYLDKYQIVRLPKTGIYSPFILFPSETPTQKIKDISELSYTSQHLVRKGTITRIQKILSNSSYNLSKLGIPVQKVTLFFIKLDDETHGVSFLRKGIIHISFKVLYFDDEYIEQVINHEWAHQVFSNLPKFSQQKFIDWFKKNIFEPTFKEFYSTDTIDHIKLTDEEIESVVKSVGVKNTPQDYINSYTLKLINIFNTKFQSVPATTVSTFLKKNYSLDKTIFANPTKIKAVLKTLGVPVNKTSMKSSIFYEKISKLAYDKGLTPSEYASTNPDELFAETIMFITTGQQEKVSRELKKIIYDTVH